MEKLGIYTPSGLGEVVETFYVSPTDMSYEVYANGIVGAYSEAVGLVTYYRMTEEELNTIRDDDFTVGDTVVWYRGSEELYGTVTDNSGENLTLELDSGETVEAPAEQLLRD